MCDTSAMAGAPETWGVTLGVSWPLEMEDGAGMAEHADARRDRY